MDGLAVVGAAVRVVVVAVVAAALVVVVAAPGTDPDHGGSAGAFGAPCARREGQRREQQRGYRPPGQECQHEFGTRCADGSAVPVGMVAVVGVVGVVTLGHDKPIDGEPARDQGAASASGPTYASCATNSSRAARIVPTWVSAQSVSTAIGPPSDTPRSVRA